MRNNKIAAVVAALWAAATIQPAIAKSTPAPTREEVDAATFSNGWQHDQALQIKLQVLLDRAHFSPGAIDGRWGMNTERALQAYQQRQELAATGNLDEQTWGRLADGNGQGVLKAYEITRSDVNGPFIKHVPKSFKAMSKLKALSYTSPEELLSEKFHSDVGLLRRLNPGARFDEAGRTITVPAVRGEGRPEFKAARIEVSKSDQSVKALDDHGTVLAYYPATIGSTDMPSPSGTLKVKGVAKNPHYRYDPKKLHFPGVKLSRPVTIAPGPNSPVGSVWIDLSKEGYGIHGSAEPSAIRRQASHGCVRLTNWDAMELASGTRPGIRVAFVK